MNEEILKRISDRILQAYTSWKDWDGGTGFDEETGEVDESEENALLREMRRDDPVNCPNCNRNVEETALITDTSLGKRYCPTCVPPNWRIASQRPADNTFQSLTVDPARLLDKPDMPTTTMEKELWNMVQIFGEHISTLETALASANERIAALNSVDAKWIVVYQRLLSEIDDLKSEKSRLELRLQLFLDGSQTQPTRP